MPHLANTNGTDLNRSAALDNLNGCIGDWSSPQILQQIPGLKPSKFSVCNDTIRMHKVNGDSRRLEMAQPEESDIRSRPAYL